MFVQVTILLMVPVAFSQLRHARWSRGHNLYLLLHVSQERRPLAVVVTTFAQEEVVVICFLPFCISVVLDWIGLDSAGTKRQQEEKNNMMKDVLLCDVQLLNHSLFLLQE